MRALVYTLLLAFVTSPAVAASPTFAELIRIPLSGRATAGVPRTHEAFERAVEDTGFTVGWQDGPYHDPYYAYNGGAEYATAQVSFANDSITFTWLRFDDLATAESYENDQRAAWGTGNYFDWQREGVWVVQVYSQNFDPGNARAALDALTGQ